MAYCPIHCPVKYLWDSGNQLLYEGFHALTVLSPFYKTTTTPDRTVRQPSSPLYSLCRQLDMAAFELQTVQQRFSCMHRIICLFHILLPMENQPARYASLPVFDFPEEKAVRHKVIVNLNFFRVSPFELVTQEPD